MASQGKEPRRNDGYVPFGSKDEKAISGSVKVRPMTSKEDDEAKESKGRAERIKDLGGFSLSTCPDAVRRMLAPFAKERHGFISDTEVAEASLALAAKEKRDRFPTAAVWFLLVGFLVMSLVTCGLGFVLMTQWKHGSATAFPDSMMPSKNGASDTVRVASAEFVMDADGAMRSSSSRGAHLVATDNPVSYVVLPDLLDMPFEVLDEVKLLTFMTVDGTFHSYPKFGVRLSRGSASNDIITRQLTYLTPVDDLTVVVRGDGTAVLRSQAKGDTRIALPQPEVMATNRRDLREAKGEHLAKRCHRQTGKCLHTREELMQLHGFANLGAERRLQAGSSSFGALAYAEITKDAFSVDGDTGFVSWEAEAEGDVVASPDGSTAVGGVVQEYDDWGCLVEDGFDTRAYPLTTKHCFLWRYTRHCHFTLDGSDGNAAGYDLQITGDTTDFLDASRDAKCFQTIAHHSHGFCECGSGLKIRAGTCADTSEEFTCAEVCLSHARATKQMTIDLYDIHDQHFLTSLRLNDVLTKEFFNVDARVEGGFTAEVQDATYFSMRLAYRRETPRWFGLDDWPEWLDWDRHVAAHFESGPDSVSGNQWLDQSGKERHASISGAALTSVKLNEDGPEEDTYVLRGTPKTRVDFDTALVPTPLFIERDNANFKDCHTRPDCIDLSAAVSAALPGQVPPSFGSWLDTGGNGAHAESEAYNRECQRQAVLEGRCGRHFDIFSPDFAAAKAQLDTSLAKVRVGLGREPPSFRAESADKDYELCAGNGDACVCNGEVRFADHGAVAATMDDGFRVTADKSDSRTLEGFAGPWAIASPALFDGPIAHYFAATGSVTCSADALVLQADRDDYAARGLPGFDLRTWSCFCRSHERLATAAFDELLGTTDDSTGALSSATAMRYEVLFGDWTALRPFASNQASSFLDERTLASMAGEGNPLWPMVSSGFGAVQHLQDGFQASCRCLEEHGDAAFRPGALVSNSADVLNVCAAAGLKGALPESAAENAAAFAACGEGAYLAIEYDASAKVFRDQNSGGEALYENWGPGILRQPDGYRCNRDMSLCVSVAKPANNVFNAITTCDGEQARLCRAQDYHQLCGDSVDPYQGAYGEWLGDHGIAPGGNWDGEYFVTNRATCDSNNEGVPDFGTAIRPYKCCRASEVMPGFEPLCPTSLATGFASGVAMRTENGEVCASGFFANQNGFDAVGTCMALGAHVCRFDEMQMLCGVGNPYAGQAYGWYGNHGRAPGGNWDDEFATWNRDNCAGGNADGAPRHAKDSSLPFRCCSGASSVLTVGVEAHRVPASCPSGWTRVGAVCFRKVSWYASTFRGARATCQNNGGTVCSHNQMQEMCGLGFNPYDGNASGWYNEKHGDDVYGTWNRASCDPNNDGAPAPAATSYYAYRCCRPATVPQNFPSRSEKALQIASGPMVKAPKGFTCTGNGGLCYDKHSAKNMMVAIETCRASEARVCREADFMRLCNEGVSAFDHGSWLGDHAWHDDTYYVTNTAICGTNIDGAVTNHLKVHPYTCCREPELERTATPDCPNGLSGGHTKNGEVCVSESLGPANMKTAVGECGALGGHVCSHTDMQQLCGAGLNPFSGASLGFYGDHGLVVGGNGDDGYHSWNRNYCSSNNDGASYGYDTSLHYRCCASASTFAIAESAEVVCPEHWQRFGRLCFRNPGTSLDAHRAIAYCMDLGGRMCEHTDLMEICGHNFNPFGQSRGWYGGQTSTDDMFGVWNANYCLMNNDGPATPAAAFYYPFRCCRDAAPPGLDVRASTARYLQDGQWATEHTSSESGLACCEGHTLTAADVALRPDEIVVAEGTTAAVYSLVESDPRGTARKGLYHTLFHIARYADTAGAADKKRILQTSAPHGGDWFDGFDDGKSGIANHHDDFVTQMIDRHEGQWVLSSSTEYSYRSNFQARPLARRARSERSLAGVSLAINPGVKNSAFDIAELLVLHTEYPLSEDQVEDVERLLYKKHAPLFMRAQYTTDTFADNPDGDTTTWDDAGLYKRHAAVGDASRFSQKDYEAAGFAVAASGGGSVTFPTETLPQHSDEVTLFSVAQASSSASPMKITNAPGLGACFSETPNTWSAFSCEARGAAIEIRSTTSGAPLLLCEVQAYAKDSLVQFNAENATNVALARPATLTSVDGNFGPDLANDGDAATCARSLATGYQSYRVELNALDQVGLVVVHAAASSGSFEVLVDDVIAGATKADAASASAAIGYPVYSQGGGPFTFLGQADEHGYSVWIESDAAVSGGYLELCEVEVFGEPSIHKTGSDDNPNVARGGIMASSLLTSGSSKAAALNDGNSFTCAKTEPGRKGIFRLDLPAGTMPTSVTVYGKVFEAHSGSPSLSCADQKLGIHGAKIYIGTPGTKFPQAVSEPLVSACGVESQIRITPFDLREQLLHLSIAESSRVCEVELFVDNGNNTETAFDLTSRPSYVSSPSFENARRASFAADGDTACNPAAAGLAGVDLFFGLPQHVVPWRILVHYESAAGTPPGASSARLSNGISLGDFVTPTSATDPLSLEIPAETRDVVHSAVTFTRELTPTEVFNTCGLAGGKEGAGPSYDVLTSSDPCACAAACEKSSHCKAWSYVRDARHPNYRRCFLSKNKITLDAQTALPLITGHKDAAAASGGSGSKTLSLSSSKPFEVAELVVFDGFLPGRLVQDIAAHLEDQYIYLLSRIPLPAPVVTLHSGFTIESHGAKWASGDEVAWEQAIENHDNLSPEQRDAFGLHPLAHAVSGISTYLTSPYLQPPCVVATSEEDEVSQWGLRPVRTTAANAGQSRTKDSYGVEIETMTLCRRLQTASSALRKLPPSTVCGLLGLTDQNPTCQPTALKAMWTVAGVTFKWLPGCRAATKYQIVRDRETQIGADFEKETTEAHEAVPLRKQKQFCSEVIEPGVSLIDFTEDLLSSVGRDVEYCVRSIVPLDAGGIVASDWTCTTVRIGWTADAGAVVRASRGGAAVEGSLLDGIICDVDDADCKDASRRSARTHHLGDGGQMLSFATFATDAKLVSYDETRLNSCKYAGGDDVEADKPDFILLLEKTAGLVWYATTPACFHVISNVRGSGEAIAFHVDSAGGLQRKGGFPGFAYHFRVERSPSWHYMAKHCRETCGLSGHKTATEDEVYVNAVVGDELAQSFCSRYKHRCPGNLDGQAQEKGALVFGADIKDEAEVRCDPHRAEFAFYNADAGGYRCCFGHRPSKWDSCYRRFTMCDSSFPVAAAPTPPLRHFRVLVETGDAFFSDEQLATSATGLPWLDLHSGNDSSLAAAEVALVEDLGDEGYEGRVDVANCWVGPIAAYFSARTDEGGEFAVQIADEYGRASSVRRVFMMPFTASHFLAWDAASGTQYIRTAIHSFAIEGADTEGKAEDPSIIAHHRQAVDPVFLDETVVIITAVVTHPTVGSGQSCGVEGILMCAFSADGRETQLDCEKTDEQGRADLRAPGGQEVKVINGCPGGKTWPMRECEREDVKVGRDVVSYHRQAEPDRPDARVLRVSGTEAFAGAEVAFVELPSRYLDAVVAAGRYLPEEQDVESRYRTTWPLGAELRSKLLFNLTHSEKPGCDVAFTSEDVAQEQQGRVFRLPIPRDLSYAVTVAANATEWSWPGAQHAATYLNSLPAQSVTKEVLDPVASFMYRKPVESSIVLNVKDVDSPLRSCTGSDGTALHGVAQRTDEGHAVAVEVTLAAYEHYTSTTGETSTEGKLLYVPGTFLTEDNLAFAGETRRQVVGGLRGASAATMEQCAPAGCNIEPAISMPCKGPECMIAGEKVEGTVYQMDLEQLSRPERYEPFTKLLRYHFSPSLADVPSEVHQAMLTTTPTQVNVVIEGRIPLTAAEAIKLPEYIPFLLLRDPPGGASSATWAKGTSMTVDLTVTADDAGDSVMKIEGSKGFEAESKAQLSAIMAPMGTGIAVGATFTKSEIGLALNLGGTLGKAESHGYNHGDSMLFTAGVSYSTSKEYTGAWADLLVTPSLAIRTVRELPVAFLDDTSDPAQCRGVAQDEVTTWEMLDGTADLEDALAQYAAAADAMAASDSEPDKSMLQGYARTAIGDQSWNALTVHTVFDVVNTRIPQLQARCLEEFNSLHCNFDTDSSYFTEVLDGLGAFDAATGKNWCNLERNGPSDCSLIAPVETASGEEAKAKARFEASLDGIKGWTAALKLNEDLKGHAQRVSTGELVQSPLLVGNAQRFDEGSTALLAAEEAQVNEVAKQAKDTSEATFLLREAGVDHLTGDEGGRASEFQDKFRNEQEVDADASIVAFSGGGVATKYSYTSSRSARLALHFGSSYTVGGQGGAKGRGNVFGSQVTFGVDLSHKDVDTGKEMAAQERKEQTSVEFTLADPDVLDTFDVMVKHDPVYGTPVFETVAGASKCVHEVGTDAHEAFDVIFPKERNELDMRGSDVHAKRRNVVRNETAAEGSCASFVMEIINETPYAENLNLRFGVAWAEPEDQEVLAVSGRWKSTTRFDQFPSLAADTRAIWRLNICPEEDERDFASRQERFADQGKLDGNGAPFDGRLFCNTRIGVQSVCERQNYAKDFIKGAVYAEEQMDTCAYDLVNAHTSPPTVSCWHKVLSEIFDGTDHAGLQYAYEDVLQREILISCLSFGATDLCAANPCEGM